MSVEENMALARRFLESQVKGDLEAMDEIVAPDFVGHTKLLPDQQPDREGQKWAYAQFSAATSNASIHFEDQIAAEDKVVTRFIVHATHDRGELMGVAPSGKELVYMPIGVHRIEGGKIAEQWGGGTGLSELRGLRLEQEERERVEQELRVARRIQQASLPKEVPTVARGTYDYGYRGNGNWPFNSAYAASYGLKTSVNRFSSLGQVERWIAKGVLVIASISWGRGRLTGAPIPASSGHLLVIRGFTEAGNVIVNDPAAGNSSGVRRIYQRDEFHRAWFKSDSGGVAYLVRPESWPVPDRTYARGTW